MDGGSGLGVRKWNYGGGEVGCEGGNGMGGGGGGAMLGERGLPKVTRHGVYSDLCNFFILAAHCYKSSDY